jgi:hypothetical protein
MSNVEIINGTYKIRGEDRSVAGTVFPLVEPFKQGVTGGYVTVDGRAVRGFPDRNIKIRCNSAEDYMHLETGTGPSVQKTDSKQYTETDDEIKLRLRERFQMLTDMTKAVKKGAVRAMIVSGPPGVGKSHGVEEVLDRYQMVETLGGAKKYEIVKGAMSAIGLYCKLYKYSARDNVIVFDDCDSVFDDTLSLNILKAALDSKKTRTIHWNTDSFKLRNEGVPGSFKFEGSAIFITNLKFDQVKSKKLREHLNALESRCHYIDLTINTEREKMLRIRQVMEDGMLNQYQLSPDVEAEIFDFVDMNKRRLRELSLRTVLKVADLAAAFPDRWEAMAENTIMK